MPIEIRMPSAAPSEPAGASARWAKQVGEPVRLGEGLFEVEILGHRRPARINVEPPFDPSGEKMRG